MPIVEKNHNANLPSIVPNNTPIVNFVEREDGVGVVYHVELAPKKLFVKIANSIFNHNFKPRLLEFYCLLCYLILAYPTTRLSYETIQQLIYNYTHHKWSVNTINKYMLILLDKKLIYKNNNFYSNSYNEDQELNSNKYLEPKNRYTNFMITIYNEDTAKGSMGLEFYLASKTYKYHRPSKVTKDLSISTKTYYKYLKDITTKSIVLKTKITYKLNHYSNIYRQTLWDEYIVIKDGRYYNQKQKWINQSKAKTAHSRLWYASPMGRIMKQYKVNYIRAFDNYDPLDAYSIVLALEDQYITNRSQLQAPLIVDAILSGYNWTKIVDRKHQKIKRELRNKEIQMSYGINVVNEFFEY